MNKTCMVCEHPDWGFVECYREVVGIEYKLLQRLCEKHTNKILAEDLKVGMEGTPKPEDSPKLTQEQIRDNI